MSDIVSESSVRPTLYPLVAPFPLVFHDEPISLGFGRGSAELGVPTANVPINEELSQLQTGVYYGWCQLHPKSHAQTTELVKDRRIEFNYGSQLTDDDLIVLPMVMSLGWNPTFDDLKEKAVEIHIIHKFNSNFYGAHMDYAILGFLRPELKFINIETLKLEICKDIEITQSLLNQQEQLKLKFTTLPQ